MDKETTVYSRVIKDKYIEFESILSELSNMPPEYINDVLNETDNQNLREFILKEVIRLRLDN